MGCPIPWGDCRVPRSPRRPVWHSEDFFNSSVDGDEPRVTIRARPALVPNPRSWATISPGMTPVPALWPEAPARPVRRRIRVDRFLVVAVLASTALRLPGLVASPSSDEAGFLLVARSWAPSPDSLYGRYWVDRPPVLIAAYRWTDALLGDLGPRLLALVLTAVLVVAVHLLASRLVPTAAARVATVVTVALLADPALSAWTAKGEVLGTPLVAVS